MKNWASPVAAFALLLPAARAQVFNVTAGGSDLYGSEGLTLHTDQDGLRTATSIGYADGFRLGGSVEKDLHWSALGPKDGSSATVAVGGDSMIPFLLPTDIFDNSHILLRRGAGLRHTDGANSWDVFAGGGAANYTTPYLGYATIDHALGMIFYKHTLTPHLQASTYLLSLGQTTAIEGVHWQARPRLSLAASAGIGSDHPFGAVSVDWGGAQWGIKASYTAQDGKFRRLAFDPTQASETVGANASGWRDWKYLHIDASRRSYQDIPELASAAEIGNVEEVGVGTTLMKFSLGAREFHTTSGAVTGSSVSTDIAADSRTGTIYTASRGFRLYRATATYFVNTGSSSSQPITGVQQPDPNQNTFVASQYLRLRRWLEVNNTINFGQGTHSYSFGGTITSNKLDVNIGQQLYFIPFAAQQQLQQVWQVSVRLHAFGNTSIEVDNQLGTDDKMHYTAYASDYLYREAAAWHTEGGASFKQKPFQVDGHVRLDSGDPVSGAALLIGKEEVYTDLQGYFCFMTSRRGSFAVALKPEDFTAPGRYSSAALPKTVQLGKESPSASVDFVLDRLPNDESH